MKQVIIDKHGKRLAIVDVFEQSNGNFQGTVIESSFPQEVILLFREYESRVNDQVFSALDEIEQKIEACELYFEPKNARIRDLQVMGANKISFRLTA